MMRVIPNATILLVSLGRSRKRIVRPLRRRGRVLDHIGFDIRNLDAYCEKFEAAGIELVRPYTRNPETGSALVFISDPWGTYIELHERPNPVYVRQ